MRQSCYSLDQTMNQHSVQEAYFKSFRDEKTGRLWVYTRDGRQRFQKPTKWCTAENDFQSELLEREQNTIVEKPGIEALRRLVHAGKLSEADYSLICQWTALHLIRNQKMRNETSEAYQKQFADEFEMELLFTKSFQYADVYTCSRSGFLCDLG